MWPNVPEQEEEQNCGNNDGSQKNPSSPLVPSGVAIVIAVGIVAAVGHVRVLPSYCLRECFEERGVGCFEWKK